MITGIVNASHEIIIKVLVRDVAGNEHEIEAMLDTGFNGSLTLPSQTIANLALPWRSSTKAVLATGNVHQLDIHVATIIWDGTARTVLVQAIDATPLLGMALLAGFDLRARVKPGGAVEIEAVPEGPSGRLPATIIREGIHKVPSATPQNAPIGLRNMHLGNAKEISSSSAMVCADSYHLGVCGDRNDRNPDVGQTPVR